MKVIARMHIGMTRQMDYALAHRLDFTVALASALVFREEMKVRSKVR